MKLFIGLLSLMVVMSLLPTVAVFATDPTQAGPNGQPALPANNTQSSTVILPNPLGAGNDDPRKIVGNIIKGMLGIVGSLALAVFIYGGFNWVASAGNEDKISQGKSMIIWASLGLLVIFFSYALVTFVLGTITALPASNGASSSTPLGPNGCPVGLDAC